MNKQDLIRKLTSRKFWVAMAGFVTALLIARGAAPDSIERIISVITAIGALITYIFAEGIADSGYKTLHIENYNDSNGEAER